MLEAKPCYQVVVSHEPNAFKHACLHALSTLRRSAMSLPAASLAKEAATYQVGQRGLRPLHRFEHELPRAAALQQLHLPPDRGQSHKRCAELITSAAMCAEFQTQSEARIQLSRTNEYFPGTSERIMMISGTVNQVLTALHLVLAKMNSEKTVQETMLARCRALSTLPCTLFTR